MNVKRVISSVAIAGLVGASTLGIGTGVATASHNRIEFRNDHSAAGRLARWRMAMAMATDSGTAIGHGGATAFTAAGYGYGNPFWHPWGWPWRW